MNSEYYFRRRRGGRLGRGGVPRVAGGILLAGALAVSGNAEAQDVVSLSSLSQVYGFQPLSIHGNSAVLSTRFHSLSVEKDSRRAAFDGVVVWLNGPIEKSWGRWRILKADVNKTILPLFNPQHALAAKGFTVVVLDPGHGGEDRGASMPYQGIHEKQLTLELARGVRDILRRYQVEVRLTRSDDRAVGLEKRYQLASAWKADVFVSIHLNAAAKARPSGIETHILAPAGFPVTADPSGNDRDRLGYPGNQHDAANLVLGYTLQKSLLKYSHAEDRGIRRSRFGVIRNSSCPAALLECGFLSNRNDRKKLLTRSYRQTLARAIAEGVLTYLNTVKRAHNLDP